MFLVTDSCVAPGRASKYASFVSAASVVMSRPAMTPARERLMPVAYTGLTLPVRPVVVSTLYQ